MGGGVWNEWDGFPGRRHGHNGPNGHLQYCSKYKTWGIFICQEKQNIKGGNVVMKVVPHKSTHPVFCLVSHTFTLPKTRQFLRLSFKIIQLGLSPWNKTVVRSVLIFSV